MINDHVSVEQSILGACLVQPDRLSDVLSKVAADDLQEPVHRQALQTLADLHGAGRTPSLESLVAYLGNDEILPNLTVREYFQRMAREAVVGSFLPLQDAIDVFRDQTRRRRLQEIGARLANCSISSAEGLASIADQAVSALDDVIVDLREAKRSNYSLSAAAAAAMAHLDSQAAQYATTGLLDLDNVLGGWPRGQLTILAGRPGMGKSAAFTSAMLQSARNGYACAAVSLEMMAEQLGARLLTDLCYTQADPIMYEDILHRRVTDARKRSRLDKAKLQLDQLPVEIEEQRGLTLSEICARTRKMVNRFAKDGRKLEILFVDHIGLIRPSQRYAGNRQREMAEISDGLATLAKDLDLAVVGLCQLNRGVEGRENKRPSLADLRDSGAIEEDASVVIFLFRAAYYLESLRYDDAELEVQRQALLDGCRNNIEYVVAKNRNGRVGIVDAFVDIGANAIRNRSTFVQAKNNADRSRRATA